MELLDIDGSHIAELTDTDLRALIGRLCEADYRRAGLPTKGIRWGGKQEAADGGLDVIVRTDVAPPTASFVPRGKSGFQVKKSKMPRKEILHEMSTEDGALKDEIKALLRESGAYCIVSGSDDTSNTSLKNRLTAMKDAVAAEPDCSNLHVEFFDGPHVATWLRSHPSLILWVRNKINRPLKGWRPFENWSSASDRDEEYLLDDALRLYDGSKPSAEVKGAVDALSEIRSVLAAPGKSVRLVGLSGVGKTRFVQALFDSRIGTQTLNPSEVFYTDLSSGPVPDPESFAQQLLSQEAAGVLVVDNCGPDWHYRLSRICCAPSSKISLITIEYDVREDLPEDTHVYRLKPASEGVIERLIGARFPHINQIDVASIAHFSGGNARVAIALASTVQSGETLSRLQHSDLFERLFWQRNEPNPTLMRSAEVCALVYSFDGEDVGSDKSQLRFLASLAEVSVQSLYRDVSTLRERDLVQKRSEWRAILPHAIANALAKQGLQSIPAVAEAFIRSGSDHLIKSFARRLGYLHDSEVAVQIAAKWLAEDGWISSVLASLSAFGIQILTNIAPVSPSVTLDAIERAANGPDGISFTSSKNEHHDEFVRLLWHLAYEVEFFDRCVELLIRYAVSELREGTRTSTRDILKSLFYSQYSGTLAPREMRLAFVERLLTATDPDERSLGLDLLDAALEAWTFNPPSEFDFGAQPRSYGYYPQTQAEVSAWYGAFLLLACRLHASDASLSGRIRKTLADKLRPLWSSARIFDQLLDAARKICATSPWHEGWIAVRGVIRYGGKQSDGAERAKLDALEDLLKPKTLVDQVRAFALSDQNQAFDLEEDFAENEDISSGIRKAEEVTRRLGELVARDTQALQALLPDLVSIYARRLCHFGQGLADGSPNKQLTWDSLYAQLKITEARKRQNNVLFGYLSSCFDADRPFYEATLDKLVDDDVLGPLFPCYQTVSTIDKNGVVRLEKALAIGRAPVSLFQYLAYGRAHESIDDDDLARLLTLMLGKDDGVYVALEILHMRSIPPRGQVFQCSETLREVARSALSAIEFSRDKMGNDGGYRLEHVVRVFLQGQESELAARLVCSHLAVAIAANRVYVIDCPKLLVALAQLHPLAFLDAFLDNDAMTDYQRRKVLTGGGLRHSVNPVGDLPDDTMLSWCDRNASKRYPLIVQAIELFRISHADVGLDWSSGLYRVLDSAPDLQQVLENLADRLRWSGQNGITSQQQLELLSRLFSYENAVVQSWAKQQHRECHDMIRNTKRWNRNLELRSEGSFE
jgi:hypothetical protein